MLLQERSKNKKAPDPINNRGNPGQKLDRDTDWFAQGKGAKLGQEDRDGHRGWHRDGHRDERGDDRAIDRRHRTELLGDGIPCFS